MFEWIALFSNIAVAVSAIISIWIAVSVTNRQGKPDGQYSIVNEGVNGEWVPRAIHVTLTNVGSKPLIVTGVGRASGDGIIGALPPSGSSPTVNAVNDFLSANQTFVLEPGGVKVLSLPVEENEGPDQPLATPIRVMYLKRSWRPWPWKSRLRRAHFEFGHLDWKPSTGKQLNS